MGKLWLNNEIVDRLAMLQQTEAGHPGVNQVAIEKDWWVTVTLKALFQTDCRAYSGAYPFTFRQLIKA